ncbi:MAG: ATP synthase F1 subunit delta [Chloroflexi bacterium]|nr:ATP synthase F1 subunit delta [Chloroflexota bacterium]
MKNVSQAAARVYAQALFDIGLETGTVGQIYDDLHAAYNALNGLDADLRTFFNLPQFRRDDKRRIINLAFEGKVGRPVLGLLNVLVEKRREPLLDNVVEEFNRYRDQHEGRVRARVVTPRKLDDALLNALRLALEQRIQKSVDLTETIDPEVLGGLRVNVGDRVLDGTLRRSLQDLRRNLAATHRQG